MNTRLLRRVAKHILAEPKRLAMGTFVQWKDESPNGKFVESYHKENKDEEFTTKTHHNFAQCGTAACIAGWATVLSLGPKKARAEDAEIVGQRILGIDGQQAEQLFYVGSWPDKFEAPYLLAKTPAKRARIAVARIEHFIKTKGAE